MEVASATLHPLGTEDLQRGRSMHRRVHVTEGPFIGRDLAIRVQVSFAKQDFDLILREVDVDKRKRAAMEREVPGGEPRILPAIRRRDDIACLEVLPIAVPSAEPALRRLKLVALQPALDIVVEELLAPDHAGQGLPQYPVVLWSCCR